MPCIVAPPPALHPETKVEGPEAGHRNVLIDLRSQAPSGEEILSFRKRKYPKKPLFTTQQAAVEVAVRRRYGQNKSPSIFYP
jgi:hypothetical protein